MKRGRTWTESFKGRRMRIPRSNWCDRHLSVEYLEERRLLAVGPELVAIGTNNEEILPHNAVLHVAPQELTFRFDSNQSIDPTTFNGIHVTGSGSDELFEHAAASHVFSTNQVVVVEFTAVQPGFGGNELKVQLTWEDLDIDEKPQVFWFSVHGTVLVTLNNTPGSQSTAADLVAALNTNTESSALITTVVSAGDPDTNITSFDFDFALIELTGAGLAKARESFGDATLEIQFTAVEAGPNGSGITIEFTAADLEMPAAPNILVNDKTIFMEVNTRPGNQTTVQQLIDAINQHSLVRTLVRADLLAGNATDNVAALIRDLDVVVDLLDPSDVVVLPGHIGLTDNANEVVLRFAETLPDDHYLVEVIGLGDAALRNQIGNPFDAIPETDGIENFLMEFELDLGTQIVAVVPQPLSRQVDGTLVQNGNEMVVYFSGADLNPELAENEDFYQLLFTGHTNEFADDFDTVTNTDDVAYTPSQVTYDAGTQSAVLSFDNDLHALSESGAGTYRLRIGNDEFVEQDNQLPPIPDELAIETDPGSSFETAEDLGELDVKSQIVSQEIEPQWFPLELPGADDEPGHRDIQVQTHLYGYPVSLYPDGIDPADFHQADIWPGISTLAYNFQDIYGVAPSGTPLHNLITENQKQRGREIFEIYGAMLGVQFFETANDGLTIVTGDLRAISPDAPMGPGAVVSSSAFVDGGSGLGIVVMDNSELWSDGFGTSDDPDRLSWFTEAMGRIGNLLGLGQTDELPPLTLLNDSEELSFENIPEGIFPGDHDIVHGQHVHRPDSIDIDLYRFELDEAGEFTAETIAERQSDASLLDTTLNLYREEGNGNRELIARNDDYFSEDSFLKLQLDPGVHFIGVSASGNDQYDPTIENTGFGGTSQGKYDLRLTFRADNHDYISDANPVLHVTGDGTQIVDGQLLTVTDRIGGEHIFEFDNNDVLNSAAATGISFNQSDSQQSLAESVIAVMNASEQVSVIAGLEPVELSSTAQTITLRGEVSVALEPIAAGIAIKDPGVSLDGDADGQPGGAYDFWFRTAAPFGQAAIDEPKSLFVDKTTSSPGMGSLEAPYADLQAALRAAEPGDIVRVVANGGTDNSLLTVLDNVAYEVGINASLGGNGSLSDGETLQVSHGVTLMIDAGVIFKMRSAAVLIGSSAPGINRSGSALQVLGTPTHPVVFTSFSDSSVGINSDPLGVVPEPGHWGGLLFSNVLDRAADRFDYERQGIFLNHVNQAEIRYAGGEVEIDSVSQVVAPADLRESRPTVAFNKITHSADAAITATPNSFEEVNFHAPLYQSTSFTSDYQRVGPDIHGNLLLDNTLNGLFVHIDTPAGDRTRRLTTTARWDDTDIAHIVADNLIVVGTPGGPLGEETPQPAGTLLRDRFLLTPRLDAQLVVDPGIVVKLDGARIETMMGAQFIAEGRVDKKIVFTSLLDDTFGAGGTFDTTGNRASIQPEAGNWGGIYVGHSATASIDQALISFGGGIPDVEGTFAGFNVIEIQQAKVRIANTILENNAGGTGGQAPPQRFGRGSNDAAAIFVRGAQPVIVGNIIRNTVASLQGERAAAININVNALNHHFVADYGRSTGFLDRVVGFTGNQGPLLRGNQLDDNDLNGLVVRGATLTTQSVWDDTDIPHIVFEEIVVPDFHSFGGLRLESSPTESLVIRLQNQDPDGLDDTVPDYAGFTATGQPLDIDDRIGGSIQVVGQPGHPVIMTSIVDCDASAGFKPNGQPQNEALRDGCLSVGQIGVPGVWRSIKLDRFSHDRNVDVITEREKPTISAPGTNAEPSTAQFLGALATGEKASDENLRLGFEVHGLLNEPADVDVYSFNASAGTEIWLDVDRTSHRLDVVVELLSVDGSVVARSNDSYEERLATRFPEDTTALYGPARTLQKSPFLPKDFYTTNPRDAGMRLLLPGPPGTTNPYHIRVRSYSSDVESDISAGMTSGVYQLQVRLREVDEVPGSTIQFADIRFATNGVEVLGQPIHSPLTGENAEDSTPNDTFADAQVLGNVLSSDRAMISLAGSLDSSADIDWYQFEVEYKGVESIEGFNSREKFATFVFDLDYADGFVRADTFVSLFNEDGELIISDGDSNHVDDRPRPLNGPDTVDLSRGTVGSLDPFLGPVTIPEGTYFIAVSSNSQVPAVLNQYSESETVAPLMRLEPLDSIRRVAEDHVMEPILSFTDLEAPYEVPDQPLLIGVLEEEEVIFDSNIVPFHLGDMTLFISVDAGVEETTVNSVDPFTGVWLTGLGNFTRDVGDIAMHPDGRLYGLSIDLERDGGPTDAATGSWLRIDTGTAEIEDLGDDGIETYELVLVDDEGVPLEEPELVQSGPEEEGVGIQFNAFTFDPDLELLFGVGNRGDDPRDEAEVFYSNNILYGLRFGNWNSIDGPPSDYELGIADPIDPIAGAGTNAIERGQIVTDFDEGGGNTLLLAVDATVVSLLGETEFRIPDGLSFSAEDAGGGITTFEFNSGPEVRVNFEPSDFVREPDHFTLDGQIYEFDTGPVLLVSGSGAGLTDGDRFTINGKTFEMEDTDVGNGVDVGSVAVFFDVQMGINQVRDGIVRAINTSGGGGFDVQAVVGPGSRVTLINDSSLDVSGLPGVNTAGDYGAQLGGAAIPVEETDSPAEIRQAIVEFFASVEGITASFEGERLNFSGATSGDFSTVVALDDSGPGDGSFVEIPIDFLAEDSAAEIAARIVEAATGAGLTAEISGDAGTQVSFTDVNLTADAPLKVGGVAPGGNVTGIAALAGELFAVSDTGGLFNVTNVAGQEGTVFIQSAVDLLGIPFAGLTAGPAKVEEEAYAELLFAVDTDGNLYAFSTTGELQSIFLDSATSVATGLGDVTGLAFSTLERNLWHVTEAGKRDGDEGHGMNVPVTTSRGEVGGGVSFYFGNETPVFPDGDLQTQFDYNYPGGAHGSLISNTFDLSGIAPEDRPTLYFNYFLDTEGTNSASDMRMRDSFRVFISDDRTGFSRGQWHLLSTNNPEDEAEADEFGLSPREHFDSTDSWRQIRIPLDEFAGSDSLRLRFDFSTAGTNNLGDTFTTGSELRALPGAELRDGQTFVINTPDPADPEAPPLLDVFELELGFTLVAPSGSTLEDGATMRIEAGGTPTIFEFEDSTIGDGVAEGNVAIEFAATLSAIEVATRMEDAIVAGAAGVTIYSNNRRLNLVGVDAADTTNSGVFLDGQLGITADDELDEDMMRSEVSIHAGMTALEVVEVIRSAVATEFAGGNITVIKGYVDTIQLIGHDIEDPGPLGVANQTPPPSSFYSYDPSLQFDPTEPSLRGMDNLHEGVYVDDLIIGFAERGELVFEPPANTEFMANPFPPEGTQILVGPYQLEIRRGDEYGVHRNSQHGDERPVWETDRSFHTNDRLSRSQSIMAPAGAWIESGQTFVVGDGVERRTFQFVERTIAEENDTLDQAQIIDLDASQPGRFVAIGTLGDNSNLASGLDVDIIAFNLVEDSIVTFDIDADPSLDSFRLPAEGALLTHLRLFDELGIEVANSFGQSAPDEPASLDSFLVFDVFSTGTYYLGVSGWDILSGLPNFDYDPLLPGSGTVMEGQSGSYQLEVIVDSGSTDEDPVPIVFSTFDDAATVARRMVQVINSEAVQEDLDVIATTQDTSNRVDLIGPTVNLGVGPRLEDTFLDGVAGFVLADPFAEADIPIYSITNLSTYGEWITRITMRLPAGVVFGTMEGDLPPGVTADTEVLGEFTDAVELDLTSTMDVSFTDFGEDLKFVFFVNVVNAVDMVTTARAIDLAGTSIKVEFDSGRTVRSYFSVEPDINNEVALRLMPLQTIGQNKIGGSNPMREQGQIIIHSNRITDALENGILVDAGMRGADDGNAPHVGPVRNLSELNTEQLVPGVTIANNLVIRGGVGGIRFNGDPNSTDAALAPMPFGRIINNTFVGAGNGSGIIVENNASPTILNNVFANLAVGLQIDESSSSTVIGGSLFQNNGLNSQTELGEFAIELAAFDPLFVNAALDNFNLDEGALAIDSSIDSLEDRPVLVTVKNPLGIGLSPILAPARDATGQLRIDDPDIESPPGQGANVFKDRGGLDRVDFIGPSVKLSKPVDNDAEGEDLEFAETMVRLTGKSLNEFIFRLEDGSDPERNILGTGIDDATVTPERVTVLSDGVALEEGIDYSMEYDVTNNIIRLIPAAGIWPANRVYTIGFLKAGNVLVFVPPAPQIANAYPFTIEDQFGEVVNFEFGSGFSVRVPAAGGMTEGITDGMWFEIGDGTQIVRFEFDNTGEVSVGNEAVGFQEGAEGSSSTDIAEAIAVAVANADLGLTPEIVAGGLVHLNGALRYTAETGMHHTVGMGTSNLVLTSVPNVSTFGVTAVEIVSDPLFEVGGAILDAIANSSLRGVTGTIVDNTRILLEGVEDLTGLSFVGSVADLAGNGLKPNQADGSTQFTISLDVISDFGDAPEANYPTLLSSNGARHSIIAGFFLGSSIDDELEGQPSVDANGDGADEDGVEFNSELVVDGVTDITVTTSLPGLLDAWIDFNVDGDWNDSDEQVFSSSSLTAGANSLTVTVPDSAQIGTTYARFRLSTAGGLSPSGAAFDGEVEDYQVTIRSATPWQNPVNPYDVNTDGWVTPADVFTVASRIFTMGAGELPFSPTGSAPPPFIDVVGDNVLNSQDVIAVANYLFMRRRESAMAMTIEQDDSNVSRKPGRSQSVNSAAPRPRSSDVSETLPASHDTPVEDLFVQSQQTARNITTDDSLDSVLMDVAEDIANVWQQEELVVTGSKIRK